MVGEVTDNIYLVNAPAGSGKTTRIKSMIINHIIEHPDDNILCITYTNRAADELKKGLSANRVHFGTIHSFLHKFIGVYFSHVEIINLYFEIYGEEIKKRIVNVEGDINIKKSNERYIEKFGDLSYEVIQQNLKSVSYNETQFSAVYYGGLSHDDLISFSRIAFDRFPILKRRLTQRFQLIFVDEYQDSSANVLKIFYSAVLGTSTKLYFLGDKMQQIYKNYDGSFELELPTLNRSLALDTNHRSIPQILNVLNKIYNDTSYIQKSSPKNIRIIPDHEPRVLICDDIHEKLESEKLKYPNALTLFLLNQKRFDSIGAGNLYRQLGKMDRYSYAQQYSVMDIIIDDTNDNPDSLIKLLFILNEIAEYFDRKSLGNIIQLLRINDKIFDKKVYSVTKHEDKGRLEELLKSVLDKYNDINQIHNINTIITTLKDTGLVKLEYVKAIIDSEEYSGVLNVEISEFRAIARYIKTPNVSTQHGVKGESHDTVFFVAEDSVSIPVVHMYSFFKLWCSTDISLTSFESFYYEYLKCIDDTNKHLGFKLSAINKNLHEQHALYLKERIEWVLEHFKHNDIFNSLCKQSYSAYLSKQNTTSAKECFKESQVYGVLCAYRLFYVGCSRAKRNLTIFIDKNKTDSYSIPLIEKFRSIGFTVEVK